MMTKYGVTSLITNRVDVGTQPAVSLLQRSMTEGVIGLTETCVISSAVHMAGLTTGARSTSASSKSDVMRGTMIIMVLSMTNLTDSVPL
jgi:hypothetical protein